MYIKRNLEDTILKYLEKREYLAIVGPRQAGKTTIIKKIQEDLKDSVYLNFEDRDVLELFDFDIKGFARYYGKYKYVFIDEFQYSRFGGKNLKYLYDLHPEFKIIISGSSAIDLTVKALKYLVGRILIFNLYQFNFSEYLSCKNNELHDFYCKIKAGFNLENTEISVPKIPQKLYNELNLIWKEFTVWGGYPRVVLSDNEEEKKEILKNIYNIYFLRDIKDIAGLIDDYKLSSLIKALALQIGQLIQYNELGSLSGYDYLSLKKYLNLLEKTYICQPVKPFYKNKRTEIVKNPKIYFFDSGLRNYVINNFNQIEQRTDKGDLYENYIYTELIKKEIKINYWRTKNKIEVDFILLLTGGNILPVESKSALHRPQPARSFISYLNEYNPKNGFILNESLIAEKEYKKSKIFFLPHWII